MSAAIATGVMDFDTVLSKTVLFTMSQAWQLGRAVLRARHLHTSVVRAIVEQLNGMVLITGKVGVPPSSPYRQALIIHKCSVGTNLGEGRWWPSF